MIQFDSNRQPFKIVNPYGATLHPDHARCDFKKSAEVCVTGSLRPTLLDLADRANRQFPFLVRMKNVIVARSGMAALGCGPFGLFSSCEAVNWGLAAAIDMVPHVHECDGAGGAASASGGEGHGGCAFKVYDKVFVTSQYDDTQIGQFILEALPRLVYHLPLLYANPDMKIHFGFTKQPVLPTEVLPHQFFKVRNPPLCTLP